jgi:hypothetical protein
VPTLKNVPNHEREMDLIYTHLLNNWQVKNNTEAIKVKMEDARK